MTLNRKLERCSRVKESIAFFSHKNQSMQYCESRLEANAALIREFDCTIVRYLTQPQSFGYKKNRRVLRYTPDALVQLLDGTFYYDEVKPFAIYQKTLVHHHYQYLVKLFDQIIGHPLRINTANSKYSNMLIPNLQRLYFFLRQSFDITAAKELIQKLPSKSLCLAELASLCKQNGMQPSFSCQLVANQYFAIPTQELLLPTTQLEFIHAE